MPKQEIPFEEFLSSVDAEYRDYINGLHEYLIANGCKLSVENKSSGYFASYTFIKTKKSAVNFLFRKKGLIVRIYGENADKYLNFMDTLPAEMIKAVEKAPVCKKLTKTAECSPYCSMGYDFTINGENFKKCKYNCFMFEVSKENKPYIKAFIENEINCRNEI